MSEESERARAGLACLELARQVLERASVEAGGDAINIKPAMDAIAKQQVRLLRRYDATRENT